MAKALSLNEIRKRAAKFVVDWRDEAGEERQQAQTFVRELLAVFGITASRAGLYERRAQRSSTGSHGYIDALVPGLCLIEMKSAGKNLVEAERQALDYIDSLPEPEVPRFVLTSDFKNFRVLDLHRNGDEAVEQFSLEEFSDKSEILSFLAGYQSRTFGSEAEEAASIKAATLMAELYEELEGSGYDDHEASIFLVRTLFCLYADDSAVWPKDSFFEFLETRTNPDGSDLGAQLSTLYQALNRTPEKRQRTLDELILKFPYVNGNIFAEPLSIPGFNARMREKLLEACAFNWGSISPAIFGSLFQAVKSKEARRELGEHYTTESNILAVIDPLFMDELRAELDKNYHSIPGLKKLRDRLGEMRFIDPACGCGNFLVVAYREMRNLDLQILERLQELGDVSQLQKLYFTADDLRVTLDHFVGIELMEWPAQIAATALHLVDHQANREMEKALGRAPEPLPLKRVTTIHVANALQLDWSTILNPTDHLYVLGNPPFMGDNTSSEEQKKELQEAWGDKTVISRLDFVTAWHAKTLELFKSPQFSGEWAYVTTNSITQGDQVPRLFGPIFEAGWKIKFAHQTFAWSSEAPGVAAVHCVIVGFTKVRKFRARIFSYENPTANPKERPALVGINGYLLDGHNVLVEKRSSTLAPDLVKTAYGSKPTDGGNFIVEPDEFPEVSADRVAAKYLRKYVGARELLHNEDRWCLWLEDLEPRDLNRSRILKSRVEAVRDFRAASKAASTREYPHHHLFRQLAKRDTSFVCVPRHVSETRRYFTVALFDADVIAGDANFTIEDPDGLQFAVMSSGAFVAWQKAVGGRLESRLRFASTLTWYTFPLPKLTTVQRKAIIAAGEGVLAARALYPERSLADHYNPLGMSRELVKAHTELDREVDKVIGARNLLTTDEERQSLLFKMYEKMTA